MLRVLRLAQQFCTASIKSKNRFRFNYATSLLPHPEKEAKGGEDALFASDNVLVVADGVGGWIQSGVDSGIYSRRLVKLVEQLVAKDKLKYIEDPKSLVRQAVNLNTQTGSATICLMTLHPETGKVQVYYLGDSIYSIHDVQQHSVRLARQQQYSFNFPVQVGTGGQNPDNGVLHQFEDVKPQNVIVLATDGIWDNLTLPIICRIVSNEDKHTLQQKASNLTYFAKMYGMTKDYESPFHLKAKQQNIDFPKQGKLDDNAAIVAQIVKEKL